MAVDPNIIPLGTWLYIDGVGIRQAQDTGGAIKGNKIDVAVDTHQNALNWAGYGTHKVYIL
ncbi:MAG: 3D domain-containing protein [Oscillospiraceae bacterium]